MSTVPTFPLEMRFYAKWRMLARLTLAAEMLERWPPRKNVCTWARRLRALRAPPHHPPHRRSDGPTFLWGEMLARLTSKKCWHVGHTMSDVQTFPPFPPHQADVPTFAKSRKCLHGGPFRGDPGNVCTSNRADSPRKCLHVGLIELLH